MPSVPPPNVIICMCDQLRWCETGCHGHPAIRTPHIDGLARRGMKFETAISNNPCCTPARSMVLTGQFSRTCTGDLGIAMWKLAGGGGIIPPWPSPGRHVLRQPTLPELLKSAGYHTSAIGKWHIEPWPSEIGFDEYLIPANPHAHTAQLFCENGGPPFSPSGYSVDYEAERVRRFLAERKNSSNPFFLYYNISPPHMPLADAPEHYTRMYGRKDVMIRPNVDLSRKLPRQTEEFLNYLWAYRHQRDHLPYTNKLPRADFDLIDLHAMYMGLVTWVDDTVGAMLKTLDETHLRENTVVLFTSDHGDNLGSHQLMGKSSLNEESIRVPLVASGPGITGGRTASHIAGLVDIAPTILDLAGITPPPHMQGRSLAPVLNGEAESLPENHAFIETENRGIGIRTPHHLLGLPWTTRPAVGDEPHYFYDLREDPFQMNNLAGTGKQKDTAASLAKMLHEWHYNTAWMPETTGAAKGAVSS